MRGLGRSAGFGGRRGSHACDCMRRTRAECGNRAGTKDERASCEVTLWVGARRRASRPCIMAVAEMWQARNTETMGQTRACWSLQATIVHSLSEVMTAYSAGSLVCALSAGFRQSAARRDLRVRPPLRLTENKVMKTVPVSYLVCMSESAIKSERQHLPFPDSRQFLGCGIRAGSDCCRTEACQGTVKRATVFSPLEMTIDATSRG